MNPYQNLPESQFWATGVAKKNMFDICDLWRPKFPITSRQKVVTFGSCFAQHFGRALRGRGFSWHITESAPRGLSEANASKFNYGVFSARTGNIYTASLLRQWAEWAADVSAPPKEHWEKNGRFYDPFRPVIEPNGFESIDEVERSRAQTIAAFKRSILEASVFVFTMGLTESWLNDKLGYEYPMCPGTAAGEFVEGTHRFKNQDFAYIKASMIRAIKILRALNPRIRILLTVSPVPLTATMSDQHVLVATMESKSILRAVAGEIQRSMRFVDYFPSYEIINSTPFRGTFFEPNQRSVNPSGVQHVMSSFFNCLSNSFSESVGKSNEYFSTNSDAFKAVAKTPLKRSNVESDDTVCEELLLDAFSPKQGGVQ